MKESKAPSNRHLLGQGPGLVSAAGTAFDIQLSAGTRGRAWVGQAVTGLRAVTVTVLVPTVVGFPLIVPAPEIEVPAGSPVAVKASVWPPVLSVPLTGTDTAVPARPSYRRHPTRPVAPAAPSAHATEPGRPWFDAPRPGRVMLPWRGFS
jgi:hypothetical protein